MFGLLSTIIVGVMVLGVVGTVSVTVFKLTDRMHRRAYIHQAEEARQRREHELQLRGQLPASTSNGHTEEIYVEAEEVR